jgi:hypothetical protein
MKPIFGTGRYANVTSTIALVVALVCNTDATAGTYEAVTFTATQAASVTAG